MINKRIEIAPNIGYTEIIDKKFKTNVLRMKFITLLREETATANAIGAGAVAVSSKDYPSVADLNKRLGDLYGANFFCETKKRGDMQILSFGASWLDNRYALEGEDITAEALKTVLGCIFAPNVNDGEFDGTTFNIVKKDLLDKIDAEINEKRTYAVNQAAKVAYEGEPSAVSCYGTRIGAENVTSSQAYEAYMNLLKNSAVEIFFVAPEKNETVVSGIRDAFAKIERNTEMKCTFMSPSPIKAETANVTEKMDVNQAKLVLCFKTKSENIDALKLLSVIYGETPFSKLFANVREKLSLCYYCKSNYVNSKNSMFIDCGVEFDNVEKAKSEILCQLDEMRKGNFTDEEAEHSMLSIVNSLAGVGDTPSSYIGWYFGRYCEGDSLTPDEVLQRFMTVRREDIMEAAESLVLDTVYLMTNEENING